MSPDGTIRWCEGKGRVEYENGRPARMTGVCMMVTRRKEAELARLAAAEESSRLKDEFLATLSHELRTPLNAILGWAQMLQAGELSAERAKQAIEVIGRNARLQAQLIEDILDVSRIITGKLEIDRVPVSISQVLETIVAGVGPSAEAKRIVVRQEIEPDVPPIEGDPKRLHQVLSNVLSNAIKFTAEEGTVVLRCKADDNAVNIEVEDSGHRHRSRVPAVRIRPLPAGRQPVDPRSWRSWSRAGHRATYRRRAWRHDPGYSDGPGKEQPYRFGSLPRRRLWDAGHGIRATGEPVRLDDLRFSWSTASAFPRRVPRCSSSAVPPCFRVTRPNRR